MRALASEAGAAQFRLGFSKAVGCPAQFDIIVVMPKRFAVVMALSLAMFSPLHSRGQEAPPASLQERSDKLDELFGALKSLPVDSNAHSKAMLLESEIWRLWLDTGNPELNTEFNAAIFDMERGLFAESERKLTALLDRDDTHSEIWNKRATLLYLMGRDQDSLSDIEKTLAIEPRHFGALSGRGMIYQRQKKLREALLSYREALETNPHLTGARLAIKLLEPLFPDL
jgi:tetratricopeptide (TPR) repeat protein